MFRANNFDKLLDKATSNLRLDPDWPTILQICDLIRQNDCSPKYAVAAVKKKLYSQNPHQAMFALLTLESLVKNCGSGIHDEVTSKAFCEMLRDLVKTTQHENLRNKILELIQAWAFAFRNSPKYRSVQDTVNILKAEGFKFPTLKESDAMFSADTAPEWADGEVCHRCRVAFSLMVRRHHCRACGQVFCQQCSSKTSTLPKFGIEKEVRVCDACFDKVSRPPTTTAKLEIVDTSSDYGPTQPQKRPPGGKTAEELQEEEELQLALALSQSEAEHKEKERKTRPHIVPETSLHPTLSPTPSSVSASPDHSSQGNAELSRYLDRTYWEQRLSREPTAAPTAPAPALAAHTSHDTSDHQLRQHGAVAVSRPQHPPHDTSDHDFVKITASKAQEDDAEDKEIDEFVETLKSQVEIFVNRMKSNSSRGRSIANDTSVQTLFMNITAMHSRLLHYIQQQDDKRVYLESLQDKVTQVRDSRAALDTLRAEHAARLAAHAEAAERQRQMQMAAKLQAMRKKKHEYLQYQRQLALQRVQEQEREMQMRQEQQKHQYMMSTSSGYYMPGATMPQYQPPFNQPMYANPQFHPQMMTQSTTDTLPMSGQPQMSQANINPMMSQAIPPMTNTFAMSTSGAAISQAPNQSITPNVRPLAQTPLQQQLMMQQMHQMRMPMQSGHQMMIQNMPNGLPGPNLQNGQTPQMTKSLQNQPQTNAMMPSISTGQQNIPQLMNSNPMMGMQMPNMRMPMMQQPNANQQVPVSGYSSMPQQNQLPNMQQPSQVIQGQPMSLPGQMMPGQSLQGQNPNMPVQNQIPNSNQGAPQGSQMSQSQHQGQPMPGQAMQQGPQMMVHGPQMMQGQNIPQQGQINQMPQNQPGQPMMHGQQSLPQQMPGQNQPQMMPQMHQGQQIPHGQQIPQPPPMQQAQAMPGQPMPGQQMPGQPMPGQSMQQGQTIQQGQPIPQGQQLPQGQPIPQGQQLPQGQPIPQGQQLPQGQPMPQGQQIKTQPNFNGQQGPGSHQNSQQSQTPVKSEHNSNTAELISFD